MCIRDRENSENVFASAEPYLVSVASPGEEGTAHYAETTTFSSKSFATKLNAAFPKASLSEKKLEEQVRIISRYASGRVESVQIGAIEVTGRQLRGALDLPSANFTIEFTDGDVRIATLGYGHGVGMSQYGANAIDVCKRQACRTGARRPDPLPSYLYPASQACRRGHRAGAVDCAECRHNGCLLYTSRCV